MKDTDGEFWCVGCVAAHPSSAFYRDRRGRPYGPCKETRRAKQRERDATRRATFRKFQELLAALNAKDPAGVISTSRVAAPPTEIHQEGKACA